MTTAIRGREARNALRDQRDLSFAPTINAHPKALSREEIEFYNREGYIKPISIFDRAGADANRKYFDELLVKLRAMNDGRDSYAINGYQCLCEGIYDIAVHPLILDYVEDIIGPNIVAWASHFFCKLPHDPKSVPWHQDASYWMLSPSRTVTVWLAIDDTDRENAAMKFLPRTHNLGPLEWKSASGNVVLDQEIIGIQALEKKFGPPVYDELKAGQISLHADMLAHSSDPNNSNRRRCGLTIRYCPPHVRALDSGWSQQAIIARGEDSSGHWSNCPRPDGDNLSIDRKPISIGGN